MQSGQVAIGVTPTLITQGVSDENSDLLIRNPGAASVYLGDDGVTTTTGFEVAAGDSVGLQLAYNEEVHGVVATGSVTVHYLRST